MNTKEEMLKEYNEYVDTIINSGDKEQMNVLKEANYWMYKIVAEKLPSLAEDVLSHLAQTKWFNYLSEREMLNINKRMTNQDGSKGFHWDYKTLVDALKDLDGKIEDPPYYNSYALVTVTNMIYSDHAESIALDLGYKIAKEVPNGKMATSCYRKAVEKLKDKDRPRFVRSYFKDMMYDTSMM